jgi:outer membrane protein TolC
MTKSIPPRDQTSRNSIAAFLVILVSFLPAPAGAQEALDPPPDHALTLGDCIALALQESPAVEASRFDVASASEEVRAAQGQALPEITGAASAELFSGSPSGKFSVVDTGQPGAVGITSSREVGLAGIESYSAHLKYPLFKDGSILGLNNPPAVASKQAKKRSLAWTTRLRREEVIDRIRDAFITTVSALNRAGYAERRVKLLEQAVGITAEQQKQGLMLPIDLKLARGQLSGARSLAKILREQAVAGTIEMSRALGFNSPSELHLSSELPEPPEPPSAEQLLGPSLDQHPSLQVQRAVIDQAKEDYRLERFRLYPTVSLDGSVLYIDDFSPSQSSIYTGAVTVNVPIFDFGAQLATARAKLMKYKAERAKLLSVADDVTFQVVKTYEEIYILSQNILSLQEEVSKADRDLQVISSQQQQGISPPLTAIEKELHLIAKRDDLDGLQMRRLVLYSTLQKAAGGSWKWDHQ